MIGWGLPSCLSQGAQAEQTGSHGSRRCRTRGFGCCSLLQRSPGHPCAWGSLCPDNLWQRKAALCRGPHLRALHSTGMPSHPQIQFSNSASGGFSKELAFCSILRVGSALAVETPKSHAVVSRAARLGIHRWGRGGRRIYSDTWCPSI